jgi:hypothetical protein
MNMLILLLLVVPLILFIGAASPLKSSSVADWKTAFLVLSSCLGFDFRRRYGFSMHPRNGAYDRTYFRTMTSGGPAASEHIELEAMLNESDP